MPPGLLELAIEYGTAYEVAMNEIKFLPFGEYGHTSIGTANLNGCSAVMVLSSYGAILGHIAPLPDELGNNPHAGDEHAQSMMNSLRDLYLSNQRYFPTGSDGWVVYAMFVGEVALSDQQRIFENTLAGLGLRCSLSTYTVTKTTDRRRTFPGQGTVFIQGNGDTPMVYIEDVDVTVRKSPRGDTSGYLIRSPSTSGADMSRYTTQYSWSPTTSTSTSTAGTSSSASGSTTSNALPKEPHYFVRDRSYYYYANGQSTPLFERPKNVWVFNENGWPETDKSKKWRFSDSRTVSYK